LANKENSKPKISFVVTARNDNYGGDFLKRIQIFIDVLLSLCEKNALDMELVIVEWNPPLENPSLADTIKWPGEQKHTHVRIVRVSEELHKKYPGSERLPLLEFVGKNVGVRRASGDFILVTNPDIIFPEEMIKFLSTAKLSADRFYRSTRFDVVPETSLSSPEEQLTYCRTHIIRINSYLGSFDNSLSSRLALKRIAFGWLGYFVSRYKFFPLEMPFTNASGDFMLMHRDHWHGLHGYPEIIGSDKNGLFHIDAFMVYEALFLGLKQVRLNNHLRIYHLEHGRPRIMNLAGQVVEDTRNKLLNARKPVIINDNNWGLGSYDLPEQIII
jgi:hypothetical protein